MVDNKEYFSSHQSMNPKDILIEEFNYPLQEGQIAKFPLKQRDKAKLLYFNGKEIKDEVFSSLPSLLDSDSLLIFNDTKVIYARLFFYKETGAKIEIFCLEPFEPNDAQLAFAEKNRVVFRCLVGNNKKWKDGVLSSSKKEGEKEIMLLAKRLRAEDECWLIEFTWDGDKSFAEIMELFGVVPLPPYLHRESNEEDKEDYQTIYANYDGSVAAPTAGLHFTDKTFQDLKQRGIESCFVTLHVGAGTFKPVSTDTIGEHSMHIEKIFVPKNVIQNLLNHHTKTIICVGTTSVRTIESLYWYGRKVIENNGNYLPLDIKQWQPYESRQNEVSSQQSLEAILNMMETNNINYLTGQTQLIIAPSYKYRIIKGMVTNFHQPKSTLLLLVSALIGEDWKRVYQHALENNYRFLSYGDACLFLKQ
ncbi:MAG: S-adenosylmethionine:tRNA ribosyltransferase-isomerase [Bacteroidales bacterium]|nr:S-adenosylmethionine:tRNA ribosyltransferase-isomerase [Bacteroidales bacterium]